MVDQKELPEWKLKYDQARGLLEKGDLDEARPLYLRVIQIRPEWIGARMGLLQTHLKGRDYISAKKIFGDISHIAVNRGYDHAQSVQDLSRAMDMIFDAELGVKKTEELQSLIRDCLEILEAKKAHVRIILYYQAALLHCQGKSDEAGKIFQIAAAIVGPELDKHSSGHRTMRDYHFIRQIEGKIPLPRVEEVRDFIATEDKSDHILFCGCDEGYFFTFAENILESIAFHKINAPIHFHIVNCNAERIYEFCKKQSARLGVNIHISLSEFSGHNKKTYYACERFFLLESIIQLHGKSVMLIDADSCFVGNPWSDLNKYDTNSILVKESGVPTSHLHLPWRIVNASFIRIPNNDFGLRFAKIQGEYIRALLDEDVDPESSWYIDQSAFYMVYSLLKDEFSDGFQNVGTKTSRFFRLPNHAIGDKDYFIQDMRRKRKAAKAH